MIVVFLWTLMWVGTADASTVCSSGCDYTKIKDAYDAAANSGDTIDVTDTRTYSESFDIKKSITIKTSTSSPATWRSNGSKNELLKVKDGETVVLEGFTFIPRVDQTIHVGDASTLTLKSVLVDGFTDTGHDGVGVYAENGSVVTIENSTFKNLKARNGGAIYGKSGSSFTLSNCTFDDNESTQEGGTIAVFDGALTVTNSVFNDSLSAGWGGTIYTQDTTLSITGSTFGTSEASANNSSGGHIGTWSDDWTRDNITITNSTFSNGTAGDEGGSIAVYWANFTLTGGSFTNNDADEDGGAIQLRWVETGSVSNATFTSNDSGNDGGAVNADDCNSGTSTLEFDGNTFTNNSASDNGGGLRVEDSDSATVTNNTFTNNTSNNTGGGANIRDVDVATLQGNTFTGNSADEGGGIRLQQVDDISTIGDFFCDNESTVGQGGAVYVNGGGSGGSQWKNNVYNENTANTTGGAVHFINHDPSFYNNHFLGNDATTSGGALYFTNADYTFINNLVAWTVGGNGITADAGSSHTMDYNNWYSNSSSDTSGSLSSSSLGSNSLFVDPKLEDYSQDGDCFNDELWPSTTSPLIDAGDPTASLNDPDGTRSDIGAFGGPDADVDLFTDADGDGYVAIYDCDDNDSAINPGATEICDAADVDENCNDLADDDDATVDTSTYSNWYEDGDEDSYGDISATAVQACDDPSDSTTTYSADNTDCNDAVATINPGATEVCDAADVDEDCDGDSDDADSSVDTSTQSAWYEDGDGDTYGDGAGTPTMACDDPTTSTTSYVGNNADCDDTSAAISPSVSEIAGDEFDQNCDGAELCFVDGDDDTYRFGTSTVASTDLDCTDSGEATASDPTGDCDDGDASIYPGADEYCDGVDNDCDGTIDENSAVDAPTWYQDGDNDTYGDDGTSTTSCAAPTGYIATGGDCDDGNSAIYPGADEYCDTVDTDCDGVLDEDDALDAKTWYADTDSDLFGDPSSTKVACYNSAGYVSDDTDCDDTEVTTYPGADEYCDSVDNDCDGTIDEDDALDAKTWYIDDDNDDYGDSGTSTEACLEPSGYADNDDDCNDGDATINPDADEICDSTDVDEDCDGLADDLDPSVDTSTQISWYPDSDTDTHGDADATATLACDDPSTATGAFVLSNTDCDDADTGINPDADEICDGVDNDCDGTVDEDDAIGAPTWYADDDNDGYGLTEITAVACDEPDGYAEFDGDCDDNDAFTYPTAAELCDEIDNDCDSIVDEDVEVVEWYPDVDGDTFGTTDDFIEDCAPIDGHVLDNSDCDDTEFDINPDADEIWYDGVDQDCDGWSDYDQDFDTFDSDEYGGTDCDDLNPEIHPDAEEIWYDGVDQDCDGLSDFDKDKDGFDSSEFEGDDCDDEDASVNPNAEEIPDNQVDEDCDGELAWSPGGGREWQAEEIRAGEGCGCAVTATPPVHHLLWLAVTGLVGIRLRRRR